MKKNCSKKGFFNNCKDWLSSKYEEPKQKINWSLLVVLSVPILIFIGLLYLASFFGEFGIGIEDYFSIEDCLKVLYVKGAVYFHLTSFLWIVFGLLIFYLWVVLNKKKKTLGRTLTKGVSIFAFLVVPLYFFGVVEEFSICETVALFLMLLVVVYLWLFQDKRVALITLVSFLCGLSFKMGKINGQRIVNSPVNERKTFNIILKNNDTILKEGDTNRYFIYKTTDYLFIMDETEKDRKKVIIKPVSDIETTSFESKRK